MELILDLCSGGSLEEITTVWRPIPDTPECRIAAPLVHHFKQTLDFQMPLHLGGRLLKNRSQFSSVEFEESSTLTQEDTAFIGCMRNLRVNGEVRFCV